jgi:hypothetical protein
MLKNIFYSYFSIFKEISVMRIQCDSLKYARLLEQKGIKSSEADGLMSTITEIDIINLYSQREVNSMISESIEKVFIKQDEKLEKQDLKLAEQRREFDAKMKDLSKYHDSQLKEQRSELLSSRRWTIGTIITVGLSLAAYLSALIHYNH